MAKHMSKGGRGYPSASVPEAAAAAALSGKIADDMYGGPDQEKEHESPSNVRLGISKGGSSKAGKVKGLAKKNPGAY